MLLMSSSIDVENMAVQHGPSTKLRSAYLDENMDTMWNEFVEKSRQIGRRVWNSTLYRMESFDLTEQGLAMHLSTIEVKEIQMSMRVPGEYDLGDRYRPYNMFVGSLVETADGKFIFGRTNTNTLSAGRIDLIGGALSHTENAVHSGNDIYMAALTEITEELNIGSNCVINGKVCSLLRTTRFNIGVVFHVALGITAREVDSLFEARQNDEIVETIQVDRTDVASFLEKSPSYLPTLTNVAGALVR